MEGKFIVLENNTPLEATIMLNDLMVNNYVKIVTTCTGVKNKLFHTVYVKVRLVKTPNTSKENEKDDLGI